MKLYVPLLNSVTAQRPLSQIHAHLITSALHRDALLATKLMESYAKTGSIDAARQVFDRASTPDSFMWGVMIKCYVWSLCFKDAISLYHHGLHCRQFRLSSFVLTPVLQACSSLCDTVTGRKIHGRLVKDGFEPDGVVGTALLQMYGDGGGLDDACRVFGEMPTRDVVSWSLMVSICTRRGQPSRGLRLFSRMHLEETEEDRALLLAVADACADAGLLREVKSLHGRVVRRWSENDEVMENSLLTAYGECGDLSSASKLFGEAPYRGVVSWSAMISSYNQGSRHREALGAFAEMLDSEAQPNLVTMMGVISSCARLELLRSGKAAHGFIVRRGIDPYLDSTGSALIAMYSSFRMLGSCLCVFDNIEKKTAASWNSLIAACSQNGSPADALELFVHMLSEGLLPDAFTLASVLPACGHTRTISSGSQVHGIASKTGLAGATFVQNSLIGMYCKCGSTEAAFRVFDEISEKKAVTWNAMVGKLSESSCSEQAIAIYERMQCQGVEMDAVTYLCAIRACTQLGSLVKGRRVHRNYETSCPEKNSRIDTALADMYAKCGDIETARKIFDGVPEKNVVLWSTIIAGYGSHGRAQDAISLFARMLESEVRPNEVTFMAILSACCHGGLVDEGLFHFDLMRERFGIEPQLDHCVAVVDLLSRAGQIDRAYEFIESMGVEADVRVWRALLNGCHSHRRADMANGIQRKNL